MIRSPGSFAKPSSSGRCIRVAIKAVTVRVRHELSVFLVLNEFDVCIHEADDGAPGMPERPALPGSARSVVEIAGVCVVGLPKEHIGGLEGRGLVSIAPRAAIKVKGIGWASSK